MALQSSGQISLANLATEFGDTAPHSLSEFYRNGGKVNDVPANANVPTSGPIGLANFYGAQALLIFNAEYIVVGGGGSGGFTVASASGGGGGGGYRSSIAGEASGGGASAESSIQLQGNITYTVTVGAGGSSQNQSGGFSQFHTIRSEGGGSSNANGGCGGGGNFESASAGSGTAGQGYSGGPSNARRPICQFIPSNFVCYAGWGFGGGGAAEAGGSEANSDISGGDGVYSPLLGYYLAGGGQGNDAGFGWATVGSGLGAGSTPNRGGGGGRNIGTSGGSGVVILKVPSAVSAVSTVGTVNTWISGASRIYQFTTSGTITF